MIFIYINVIGYISLLLSPTSPRSIYTAALLFSATKHLCHNRSGPSEYAIIWGEGQTKTTLGLQYDEIPVFLIFDMVVQNKKSGISSLYLA